MKSHRFLILILLLIPVIWSSCEKDYLEPFNFHMRGTYNGDTINFEMNEDFEAVTGPEDYAHGVFSSAITEPSCNGSAWEEESRWDNRSGATVVAEEQIYFVNFAICTPDSIQNRIANSLAVGELEYQQPGNGIPFGVEIRVNGDGNGGFYSTELGDQTGSTFEITRHQAVDGQEFAYITEGRFNCVLYNSAGDSRAMNVTSFKMKTLSTE